ncbi:MAG: DUF2255 family protein [Gammaproteobacteria bacterium]|nr:DUF2255 family protein [Gammaproteobacteria bacterium]NIW45100.1 DUF2255 family protein [Gammaproteobacteria bacterium]
MTTWSNDELQKIGTAEELQIAPRRQDGTLRDSVTIWVVRHDDNLYVRSYRGQNGSWYRAAQKSGQGRIRTGGIEKEVRFIDADADLNDQIDAAYRSKYRRYPQYVRPMLNADIQSTTLKLVPKDTNS